MPRHETPNLDSIHRAAFNGHQSVVRRLITSKAELVKKTDGTDSDALIWASRNGHVVIVALLLRNGSDVNAKGGYFGSALYVACSKGHEKIVRVLLDWGADQPTFLYLLPKILVRS